MPSYYDLRLQQRGVVRVIVEDGHTTRQIDVAVERGALAPLDRDHDLPFGGRHSRAAEDQRRRREEAIGMIERAVGHLLREQIAAADPVRGEERPERAPLDAVVGRTFNRIQEAYHQQRPPGLTFDPARYVNEARPSPRPGREARMDRLLASLDDLPTVAERYPEVHQERQARREKKDKGEGNA